MELVKKLVSTSNANHPLRQVFQDVVEHYGGKGAAIERIEELAANSEKMERWAESQMGHMKIDGEPFSLDESPRDVRGDAAKGLAAAYLHEMTFGAPGGDSSCYRDRWGF